jgi:hypothetical protein
MQMDIISYMTNNLDFPLAFVLANGNSPTATNAFSIHLLRKIYVDSSLAKNLR